MIEKDFERPPVPIGEILICDGLNGFLAVREVCTGEDDSGGERGGGDSVSLDRDAFALSKSTL
jgi:hypothetical protein